METPKVLSHKPIISVNHYHKIDGKYANKTDAKGLSIGLSQYDPKELSLKVWRKGNFKWKRQSEELPIHRVLDLAILLISSLNTKGESPFSSSCLGDTIDKPDKLDFMNKYFSENEKHILPRIKELKRLIDDFMNKE